MIERIASPEYNSPPLVVFGPFGTGKTFTLNQAVRLLVQLDKAHRILLCTHSNRAADIHVEHLHKYLTEQNGIPAARPLRIYQPMRRYGTEWNNKGRITLHYVTLRYITLHYITQLYSQNGIIRAVLHYVTLRYITLHYIT